MNLDIWSPSKGDVLLTRAVLESILGGSGGTISNTTITTAGNGTLTAAGLAGGQITRTGPTAAFTDTTDTAAAIVAAEFGTQFQSGSSIGFVLKNNTAWPQTLAAGTGVTMSTVTIVPPFSVGVYFGTIGGTAAAPTVAFAHQYTTPRTPNALESSTALNTVGAGTITAAGIAGQVTARGGTQTVAFTDTSDTAVAIIVAMPNALIGQSFEYTYVNNTIWPATLTNGVGVTLAAVVPPNSWARFLVTYSAAATVIMTQIGAGFFTAAGTFVANGATPVTVANAAMTATSQIEITLKTVGGTVSPTRPNPLTVTPGTGFTVGAVAADTSTYNYRIWG